MANTNKSSKGKSTKSNTVEARRGVTTTYLGPTNFRGSRVKVTHLTTGESKTISWDDALNVLDNHTAAARLILGAGPLLAVSDFKRGYVFINAEASS